MPASPPRPQPEPSDLLHRMDELERAASPLDPGPEERRRLLAAVVASGERFLADVEARKGYEESEDQGSGLLRLPIGEEGISIEEAIGIVEHDVVRPGSNTASGRHLAYIPGGGLYASALGDYLAAVTNKHSGIFFSGPGAVRMENLLVRWVADLLAYPAGAGGSLLSGGSLATLTAVAAARDAHGLRGKDYASAVVYLTAQAHHCLEKALHLAGLAEVQVRQVEMDEGFRLRPEALAAAIAADRARGLRPWLVVATAGTTDTGAVDPLGAIGEIAEKEGCWHHVDAAYGGFFLLTGRGRELFRGIERSDSAVLDPHKGLSIPYGTGVVVVRDVRHLARTHGGSGHYLQDAERAGGEISAADVSPELTRHFRALRLWLPLVLHGVGPFRAALEEKLLLARYFHREVAKLGFEVGPTPDLSVVTYRWAPPGASPERCDEINRELVERIRRDGRVFLSSTRIGGRFVLRMAALAFRTHRRTIDLALEILREQAAAFRE